MYSTQFKSYLRAQRFSAERQKGEEDYIKKWSQLSDRIDVWSYRFFTHYCPCNPNIVPEDIGHTIIEAKLNPPRYRGYYSDKNMYHEMVPNNALPTTIVCRINGSKLLDENYCLLDSPLSIKLSRYRRVILKPTVDSDSGRGVMLFGKEGGTWAYVKDRSIKLDENFLLNYGKDFVLQEAIEQHPDLAMFNTESVNTLRVAVYKSVVNEQPHVISSVIRIGRQGEFVDNAHAGGRFVGIDISTGILHNKAMDQYGNSTNVWNDIDFSKCELRIPYWEDVKALACSVASRMHHMRLIAFDLTVDKYGLPRMIEANVGGFSFWLFMYTNQNPLGDFTDEIINYCKE